MAGFIVLLLIIATPFVIGMLIAKKQGGAAGIMAKRRDREIETAMRLGMRDAEAQERIGNKIRNEYYE